MDKLNSLSYAYHYRSLDSTEHFAREALALSQPKSGSFWNTPATGYPDGKAEALNNLAFVSIARMRYDEAKGLLDSVPAITDNHLELLVACIQQMRLCQRRSHNREFYDYREQAMQSLRRIDEERAQLSAQQQARLAYAESELAIVTSTYYYYVGLEEQSRQALLSINPLTLSGDTCQLLNYLYNVGAGGIIDSDSQEEINQREFDDLFRCLVLAQQSDYPYFMANALEALAEHLLKTDARDRLMQDNPYAVRFINMAEVEPHDLPSQLADEALCLFQAYGDVYQTAGAYRTLASCSHATGNDASALYYLEQALSDSLIGQAPDLVASIREQMSVAFSAIDDKAASDYNRNIYLDLQEQTRQDRSLEARAGQLDEAVAQLNRLLWAIGAAFVLLVVQFVVFIRLYRRRKLLGMPDTLAERTEEIGEQLAVSRLHIENGERRHLEQRAKISLAVSITPFIDRILYEVRQPKTDKAFIAELTDKINEQNDLLTEWIQMRQGELMLNIETFSLQPLFATMERSRQNFQMRGLTLTVLPTTASVKADRVLTLFMLNTLADNARKFTPSGGHVEIAAKEGDDYVELSVTDDGLGMDEAQLSQVFNRKTMVANSGFGLLNCKGIIEKYRKTSRLFSVCQLGAESHPDKGSRFFFRLPKGLRTILLLIAALLAGSSTPCRSQNSLLWRASSMADSAYFSNIRGTYAQTLCYADSCRMALNAYYRSLLPHSTDTLLAVGNPSLTPAEISWLKDSVRLNYDILLTMRNEHAVAALALHQWDAYSYNNRIYTQLFKELSADTQLTEYCRRMLQAQTNRTTAIVLLVLLFIAIVTALGLQLLQAMRRRDGQRQQQQDGLDLLEDELRRAEAEEARLHVSNLVLDNCLSALKHETMYYPSRIRQLALQDQGQADSHEAGAALAEVTAYYRELHGLLTRQAMTQTDAAKLHLQPLDGEVLGDRNLIGYLFDILQRQARQPIKPIYTPIDSLYVECRLTLTLEMTSEQARLLFTPAQGHTPYLLCRQIVRDHGEATGRRACGIRAEACDKKTEITIILPRQICKTSK